MAVTQTPSNFNLEAFQGAQFEGEGDTRRLQIEAKEYQAFVVGPYGEKGKTCLRHSDKGYLMLDVVWQPEDPEQQQKLGIDKMPTVRQTVFLDVTAEGGLDMGPFKNADLNKLREVFDLNKPGVRWAFSDFVGRPGHIFVTHRPNPEDSQNPYMDVKSVRK